MRIHRVRLGFCTKEHLEGGKQPQNNTTITSPGRQLYLKQPPRALVKGHSSGTGNMRRKNFDLIIISTNDCIHLFYFTLFIRFIDLVNRSVCTHYFVWSGRAAAAGPATNSTVLTSALAHRCEFRCREYSGLRLRFILKTKVNTSTSEPSWDAVKRNLIN